jgi:thiol-disulfide isomerase/thioredoxin
MKYFSTFLISILTAALIAGTATRSIAQTRADMILQQVAEKLNKCQTISYHYNRSINYISEDYHNEFAGNTFLDFKSDEKTLGFKFQFENEQDKVIYNGSEKFELNKKEKTIKLNNKPSIANFESAAFFMNALVTLKKVLPVLIADKALVKTLSDTTINKKQLHMLTFVLHNQSIDYLGSISAKEIKIDIQYKLIVDKESLLPAHVIQSNNLALTDYVMTSFTDIKINTGPPTEDSWYYSTYSNVYKPAEEKKLVLIKQNTIAPDWLLHWLDNKDSIRLSDLKGKVILLEFWIKNCAPCIASVPKLNAMVEKYKAKRFQIIGINGQDSKENMNKFYKRLKPNYKTVVDNMNVTESYGIDAFPQVVLLDKKGIVIYAGDYDQSQLNKFIQKALR